MAKRKYGSSKDRRSCALNYKYIKNVHVRNWARNKDRDRAAGIEKKIGPAGHVYLFSLGYDNLYKIGCTYNIQQRLNALKASNPRVKCIWSAYVNDMKSAEAKIHKHLKDMRVEREIYKLEQKHVLHVNTFVNNLRESREATTILGSETDQEYT